MLFINARGYSNISNDSRLRIFQVYAPRIIQPKGALDAALLIWLSTAAMRMINA